MVFVLNGLIRCTLTLLEWSLLTKCKREIITIPVYILPYTPCEQKFKNMGYYRLWEEIHNVLGFLCLEKGFLSLPWVGLPEELGVRKWSRVIITRFLWQKHVKEVLAIGTNSVKQVIMKRLTKPSDLWPRHRLSDYGPTPFVKGRTHSHQLLLIGLPRHALHCCFPNLTWKFYSVYILKNNYLFHHRASKTINLIVFIKRFLLL